MYSDTAYNLFCSIYALFGKNPPLQTSPVFKILLDNIAEIPDECGKFIYQQAQEQDYLPSNLTKFFRKAHEMWRSNNGGDEGTCPDCGGTGGTTFLRYTEGKWIICFSPCPTCTFIPDRCYKSVRPRCYTRAQLEKMARTDKTIAFIPEEYKGNEARFMFDADMVTLPKKEGHDEWLNGFRERYRQGKALMRERERREADYDGEA